MLLLILLAIQLSTNSWTAKASKSYFTDNWCENWSNDFQCYQLNNSSNEIVELSLPLFQSINLQRYPQLSLLDIQIPNQMKYWSQRLPIILSNPLFPNFQFFSIQIGSACPNTSSGGEFILFIQILIIQTLMEPVQLRRKGLGHHLIAGVGGKRRRHQRVE